MPDHGPSNAYGELWDWRRQVAALYAGIRTAPPAQAWQEWRRKRDDLFRDHPQSPLDMADRAGFRAVPYFPYDPAWRFVVAHRPVVGEAITLDVGADGAVCLQPFAETIGLAGPLGRELTMFWVEGYGGGVFLPFWDETCGAETYGAGRYLLDTIKGADLGADANGQTILDFNFAYNPSCSYSDRYVCPLAPVQNRLPVAIRAGEMKLGS